MSLQPIISLIVATYNGKEYLRATLKSIAEQTMLPNEVIVADDGSSDGSDLMIQEMQKTFPCKLIHLWHEDDGFRKPVIINKAIAKSIGEYIIHIDGDSILEKHFVEDHLYVARKGYMTGASRTQVKEKLTKNIFKTQNINIPIYSAGIYRRINSIRIKPLMKCFLDNYKKDKPYLARGCNMAFWKADAIAVNGFNENFNKFGPEDIEFVARLNSIGIKRQFLKFGAIQFHLYHKKRSSKEKDPLFLKMLQDAIDGNVIRLENGIDKYLPQ